MGGLYETLSGAKGLRAEGASAKNISYYNAEVAEQQGKAALLQSGFDQMQQAKEAERIKGSVEANIGAAGAAGSPVAIEIKKEQASELELENLLIGYRGMVENERAKNQATLDRLQGDLAKQAGKNAARRANIGFGLQLATLGMMAAGSFGGGGGETTGTHSGTSGGGYNPGGGTATT